MVICSSTAQNAHAVSGWTKINPVLSSMARLLNRKFIIAAA
jgi:hypothetical protein